MSIADEARAEAEKRWPHDYARKGDGLTVRQAFLEGAEWQASRTPEAAPSDTDREALKEILVQRLSFGTGNNAEWNDALADGQAFDVLEAGFSRTSQPVQVEVTAGLVSRIAEVILDLDTYLPDAPHPAGDARTIARAVLAALEGEPGVQASCTLCGTGLMGWPSVGPTVRNARRHLDDLHPGWAGPDTPEGQATT